MVHFLLNGYGCICISFRQHYPRNEPICALYKVLEMWWRNNIPRSNWRFWCTIVRGTSLPHYWMDQINHLNHCHSRWCKMVTRLLLTFNKYHTILCWCILGHRWWLRSPWRMCKSPTKQSFIPTGSTDYIVRVYFLGVFTNCDFQNQWLHDQTRWRWRGGKTSLSNLDPQTICSRRRGRRWWLSSQWKIT